MKKLKLLGSVFALVLLSTLAITSPTYAWSGDPSSCDYGSFNPVNQFNTDFPDTTIGGSDQSVIFTSGDDGQIYVYRANTGTNIKLGSVEGNNQFEFSNDTTDPSTVFAKYDSTAHTLITSDPAWPNNLYDTDVSCIYGATNLGNSGDHPYTGGALPSYPSSGGASLGQIISDILSDLTPATLWGTFLSVVPLLCIVVIAVLGIRMLRRLLKSSQKGKISV